MNTYHVGYADGYRKGWLDILDVGMFGPPAEWNPPKSLETTGFREGYLKAGDDARRLLPVRFRLAVEAEAAAWDAVANPAPEAEAFVRGFIAGQKAQKKATLSDDQGGRNDRSTN